MTTQRVCRVAKGSPRCRPRTHGGVVAVLLAALAIAGCSDDGEPAVVDVTSAATTRVHPTAAVDPSFAGDAFDATCAALEEGLAAEPVQRVEDVLSSLTEIGGEAAAENTLRLAAANRCPEWLDAVETTLGEAP
jgi:hypothetical protein